MPEPGEPVISAKIPESPVVSGTQEDVSIPSAGRPPAAAGRPGGEIGHRPSWVRRHRTKLAIGATAASIAVTFLNTPFSETVHTLADEAPYLAGSMVALEAMWIGGAAMMLASTGKASKNPFKIKARIKEVAQHANDSMLFQSGFWINTSAAVGEFVVPTVAICTILRPESWGILSLPLLDLGATIGVRQTIRAGIRDNLPPEAE